MTQSGWVRMGLLTGALLGLCAPLSAQDCPMFGGTPQRNMVNLTAKNVPTQWTESVATATATLVPVRPPSNAPNPALQPTQPTATPTPAAPVPPAQPQAQPTPTLPAPAPQTNANVIAVPSVIGLSEADAKRAIQAAGLTNSATNFQTINDVADKAAFNRTAAGRVLSQIPGPGQTVAKGTTVFIAVRKS